MDELADSGKYYTSTFEKCFSYVANLIPRLVDSALCSAPVQILCPSVRLIYLVYPLDTSRQHTACLLSHFLPGLSECKASDPQQRAYFFTYIEHDRKLYCHILIPVAELLEKVNHFYAKFSM